MGYILLSYNLYTILIQDHLDYHLHHVLHHKMKLMEYWYFHT